MTPNFPTRCSPRLKDYDYAQEGAYFVTICTYLREWRFGDIVESKLQLNGCGQIAAQQWVELSTHYPTIELDAFIVMPNHVHGIVVIQKRADFKSAPTPLSEIIRGYKGLVTRRINECRRTPGEIVWQRSYHDHIIRSESALNYIRHYVATNPERWQYDQLFRRR
jgi:putative transposase